MRKIPNDIEAQRDGEFKIKQFLHTEVDFDGNGIITFTEVTQALDYRHVDINFLPNLPVWCKYDISAAKYTDCLPPYDASHELQSSVDLEIVLSQAINCFINTPKHNFDCSAVNILEKIETGIPIFDDNDSCKPSDKSWNPTNYAIFATTWSFDTSTYYQSMNAIMCVYVNGYFIDKAPFNTADIFKGTVKTFIDPDNTGISGYRRVYCMAVYFAQGNAAQYECSSSYFHVSHFNKIYFLSID